MYIDERSIFQFSKGKLKSFGKDELLAGCFRVLLVFSRHAFFYFAVIQTDFFKSFFVKAVKKALKKVHIRETFSILPYFFKQKLTSHQ